MATMATPLKWSTETLLNCRHDSDGSWKASDGITPSNLQPNPIIIVSCRYVPTQTTEIILTD